LCSAIELDRYSTELFPWGSLQVAEARSGQCAFEPPPASPDHGRRIAGYYAYVFPSTMLNYYPWGLSLNAVRPRSPELTQVSFRSYVWDEDKLERGAGAGLDEVEAEDERMVESVHSAVAAGLRVRGRYAPHHERAVHQFHLLLDGMLARGE
jgi:choline monooxygenase